MVHIISFRVRLVGEMENWENKKWWEDRKDFNFTHFCLVGSAKMEGYKKMSLNKFTHISLLKNEVQLKPKSDQKKKKKSNHPNLLKKIIIMSQKQ